MTTERTPLYNQDTSDDMALAEATFESRRPVVPSRAEAVLRERMERTRQVEPDSPSRLKRFLGGAAVLAVTAGLVTFVADQFLDALDAQAQHVQEVSDEYMNLPNGGGIDTLEP